MTPAPSDREIHMNEQTSGVQASSQQPAASAVSNNERRQFLTFSAGEEEYGTNIMHVREIIGYSQTTRLPNTPPYMKGVINLRGSVIPVFDLNLRLGHGETVIHEKSVVVIVDVGGKLAGMLVDHVSDMLGCNDDDIRPAPQLGDTSDENEEDYITGIVSTNDKMIVLIEPTSLFRSDQAMNEILEDTAPSDDVAA